MKMEHKNVSSLLPLRARVKLFVWQILGVFYRKWPEFEGHLQNCRGQHHRLVLLSVERQSHSSSSSLHGSLFENKSFYGSERDK